MAGFLHSRISERVTAGTNFHVEHPSRLKLYNAAGGLEQVVGSSPPKHYVNLAHGIKTQEDFLSIQDAFYVVVFTPHTGLLVKNWQDFVATQSNSRGTIAGGSPSELQLQRAHTFGSVTLLRNIYKPRATPTPAVYRTRAAVTTQIASSVDTTTGIASISGHIGGDTYTWTGEFDLPMTFSDNQWRARLEGSKNNLWVVSEPILMEELTTVSSIA
jgi:hypothetical protein